MESMVQNTEIHSPVVTKGHWRKLEENNEQIWYILGTFYLKRVCWTYTEQRHSHKDDKVNDHTNSLRKGKSALQLCITIKIQRNNIVGILFSRLEIKQSIRICLAWSLSLPLTELSIIMRQHFPAIDIFFETGIAADQSNRLAEMRRGERWIATTETLSYAYNYSSQKDVNEVQHMAMKSGLSGMPIMTSRYGRGAHSI